MRVRQNYSGFDRQTRLLVRDAIVGGGILLQPGQIVSPDELGPYAAMLVEEGAVVCLEDKELEEIDPPTRF